MAQNFSFSNTRTVQYVQEVKIYYGALAQTLDTIEQFRKGKLLPKEVAAVESQAIKSQDKALHTLRKKFEGEEGGLDDEAKLATAKFFRSIQQRLNPNVFNELIRARVFEYGLNGAAGDENKDAGDTASATTPA